MIIIGPVLTKLCRLQPHWTGMRPSTCSLSRYKKLNTAEMWSYPIAHISTLSLRKFKPGPLLTSLLRIIIIFISSRTYIF